MPAVLSLAQMSVAAQLSTEMQTDCAHALSKLFIECLVEKG